MSAWSSFKASSAAAPSAALVGNDDVGLGISYLYLSVGSLLQVTWSLLFSSSALKPTTLAVSVFSASCSAPLRFFKMDFCSVPVVESFFWSLLLWRLRCLSLVSAAAYASLSLLRSSVIVSLSISGLDFRCIYYFLCLSRLLLMLN